MSTKVLVTAALPYANGSIHLGHMLEAIQTDVYVRARRLCGHDVRFIWAADTHGTPIQIRAQREGIKPEDLIQRMHDEHEADYRDFNIGFDIYYTTHSPETKQHAEAIFKAIEARGDISTRSVEQFYCLQDRMFLPDRFVRGQCPRCGAADQYGDVCEKCGATYTPTELIEARCALCGTPPLKKPSEQLFVSLARYESFLRQWISSSQEGKKTQLQRSVRNHVEAWIDGGLRDWDISRNEPYFGFTIPGHPDKYFYVWFDAPIGYIGATQKWCDEHGQNFEQYWKNPQDNTEIIHVIGKDIVYFHCLFWPAMLYGAGYTTPSRVQVHGWLQVNGEKMSKTRGTFILARTYLKHLSPAYLRYYFAAKLTAEQDDFDLNMEDFANRVNADLVKKSANLASRCSKFITSRLASRLGTPDEGAKELLERAKERVNQAAHYYLDFEFAKALRLAMEIAEDFNVYLTEQAPWNLVSKDPERARSICSAGIYASKMIAAILKPVLPEWAEKTERMLRLKEPLNFANGGDPLPANAEIDAYETLAEPLDVNKLTAIVEESKESMGMAIEPEVVVQEESKGEPLAPETSMDAFDLVDLRVGKVIDCQAVKGADKLLQLSVDLGPLGRRSIFSGIAQSYAPEQLIGKHVVVFANLKPRKMRFGMSEGMILAAGEDDTAVRVVELDLRSQPGDRIR